jgi:hypothetical protein
VTHKSQEGQGGWVTVQALVQRRGGHSGAFGLQRCPVVVQPGSQHGPFVGDERRIGATQGRCRHGSPSGGGCESGRTLMPSPDNRCEAFGISDPA